AAEARQFVAVGTGDVWGDEDVRQLVQGRVGGKWFGVCHVEYRAQAPTQQLLGERIRVDEAAAGRVDQGRPVAHQRELVGSDEVKGLRGLRCVHADDITGAQEHVEVDQMDAERFGERGVDVGVEQIHV